MIAVLLQTLLFASSGLLSVGSITLVILLLISERGWRNGLGYALGYTSAYSLMGASVVALGYRASAGSSTASGSFFPLVLIILGALLLWMSLRNARRPAQESSQPPRFFAILDQVTPIKAFGFGALVSVMNVKNLMLFLTAQSVVIQSGLSLPQKLAVAFLASLIFCLSVMIPVLIYVLLPGRARMLLQAFKSTLERRSRQIGIWLPLIFGLLILAKGIRDLL